MSVTDERSRRRGLDGYDCRRLRAALRRAAVARHFRRLQAVWLLANRYGLATICHMTGLSRQSVYNALHRYCRRRDPADLADRPRSGRPPAAPAVADRHILAALRLDPRSVGYNATTWTVRLLAQYLSAHHGQVVGPRTLRRRLHRLKLRWKRPRYVYHLKDPHAPRKKGALCGA